MSAACLKMKPEKCQLLIPEERMHRAHHIAKRHLEVSAKRRKDYYDMKSNLISIVPLIKYGSSMKTERKDVAKS